MISLEMKHGLFTVQSRLDVYLAQSPAGTSVQNMLHWSQVRASCFWCDAHTSMRDPQAAPPDGSLQGFAGTCHCPLDISSISINTCWFPLLPSHPHVLSVWSLGLVPRYANWILILRLLLTAFLGKAYISSSGTPPVLTELYASWYRLFQKDLTLHLVYGPFQSMQFYSEQIPY